MFACGSAIGFDDAVRPSEAAMIFVILLNFPQEFPVLDRLDRKCSILQPGADLARGFEVEMASADNAFSRAANARNHFPMPARQSARGRGA